MRPSQGCFEKSVRLVQVKQSALFLARGEHSINHSRYFSGCSSMSNSHGGPQALNSQVYSIWSITTKKAGVTEAIDYLPAGDYTMSMVLIICPYVLYSVKKKANNL